MPYVYHENPLWIQLNKLRLIKRINIYPGGRVARREQRALAVRSHIENVNLAIEQADGEQVRVLLTERDARHARLQPVVALGKLGILQRPAANET